MRSASLGPLPASRHPFASPEAAGRDLARSLRNISNPACGDTNQHQRRSAGIDYRPDRDFDAQRRSCGLGALMHQWSGKCLQGQVSGPDP